MGGWDGSLYANVEEYDPVADKWTRKGDMPVGVNGMASVTYSGKIYVIGGEGPANTIHDALRVYDPIADTWTNKASMNQSRVWASAAEVNGKIYAIGGGNSGGTYYSIVEEYDPTADTWTNRAAMPTPRDNAVATVFDGKIYVCGGRTSGGSSITVVEIYDPGSDTWSTGTSLPSARSSAAGGAINNRTYLAGGYDGGYMSTAESGTILGVDSTPPDPPSAITVTDPGTGGTLDLSWNNPTNSDFDHIKIFRCPHTNDIGYLVHDGVSGTSTNDTGLGDELTYYYTVIAVDTNGNWSTNRTQIVGTPTGLQPALFRPGHLEDGLVGYWTLDEASGTRADSSGNGNHLESINGVGYATNDYWQLGEGAADFEKSESDYLRITDAAQTGLDLTNSYTISAWIRLESVGIFGMICGKSDGVNGYAFGINTSDRLIMHNLSSTAVSPGHALVAGKWYHVALVFDGANDLITFKC